jgi:restriction endonuclease S subunit
LREFNKFNKGEKGEWFVSPDRIENRMDVKYCIPLKGRFIDSWIKAGFEVKQLKEVCEPREEVIEPKTDFPDEEFRILTITYTGRCRADEIRIGSEINYKKMLVVRTGDIVFSEYNTFHGAIGYITDEFDGCLASGSYTVVRCNNIDDSLYIWSILRTTEIRAEFLTSAVGMGRQTIDWDDIKTVSVPFLATKRRQEISKQILNAWQAEIAANKSIDGVSDILHQEFNVESKESVLRFLGAKPPR